MKLLVLASLLAITGFAQTDGAQMTLKNEVGIAVGSGGSMCGTDISGETTEDQHSMTYVFTADISNYIFDTCLTGFDTMLQVLDSNGNELHFNDDHSGHCESGNNQYASHLETELQIGQTYKLKINGYCASCFGRFTISVSCPDPCAGVNCLAPARCGDGTLAPVSADTCCGDANLCPDPCASVNCLTSAVCGDGTPAPVPEGACCGDASLCPPVEDTTGEWCADENGHCRCVTEVRYGANGKFSDWQSAHGSTFCSNRVFGDPIGGVKKSCYCKRDFERERTGKCADENGACHCTGRVRYGANGVFTDWRNIAGTTTGCNNVAFGDPIPGVVKACYCDERYDTGNAVKCADENGQCSCNGQVRYGMNGVFTSWREVTGSIGCNNGVFGDPLHGTVKACYCRGVGSQTELESKIEKAAAAFEAIDATHNIITMLAFIGVISLICHGGKKIHKVLFGTTDFQKIDDDIDC